MYKLLSVYKKLLLQHQQVNLPVKACVEAELCRPTASVTTVMTYKVPGIRSSISAKVVVFVTVMFLSRTPSWFISKTLKLSVLPGPTRQNVLRLSEDEDTTCRLSTAEGAAGGTEGTPLRNLMRTSYSTVELDQEPHT